MTDSAALAKPQLPLAERIRTARKALRPPMTTARLARELNVDTRTVARWQSGHSRPSYERLIALAELLNRPPSYFLDEEAA